LPHPPRIVIMLSTADTTAELRVRDNGPGFEAASLTRIFEPFFTTKRDGMGLGLSLCVTLVERYGGTIAARNLEGGGAELTVRLPLMESALGTLLGEAAE
jgi:signal transduction histidine kinase